MSSAVKVRFAPTFFGKVMPSPSLNVRVCPLTVTVSVEWLVLLTPCTTTRCRYSPSSPAGFSPQARR